MTVFENDKRETPTQTREQYFESFCDGLIAEGKMMPSEKKASLHVLMTLDSQKEEFEFEESGTTKRVTLVEMHMANLKALHAVKKTNEVHEYDRSH